MEKTVYRVWKTEGSSFYQICKHPVKDICLPLTSHPSLPTAPLRLWTLGTINAVTLSTHADRQGADISFTVRFFCNFVCLYGYGFLCRGL